MGKELKTSDINVVYVELCYKEGYCPRKVALSSHLASQNLIYVPSLTVKVSKRRIVLLSSH
jgi:hypothetical protein